MKQKKNASSAGAGRRIVNEMRLRLPASSVNEGVARGTVGAFLAQLDPTVEELADLKCVVSEAVTNCVVHAYGGRGGAIYITVRARADREVELSVRDCGCGIADVAEAMRPMFTTDKSGVNVTVTDLQKYAGREIADAVRSGNTDFPIFCTRQINGIQYRAVLHDLNRPFVGMAQNKQRCAHRYEKNHCCNQNDSTILHHAAPPCKAFLFSRYNLRQCLLSAAARRPM